MYVKNASLFFLSIEILRVITIRQNTYKKMNLRTFIFTIYPLEGKGISFYIFLQLEPFQKQSFILVLPNVLRSERAECDESNFSFYLRQLITSSQSSFPEIVIFQIITKPIPKEFARFWFLIHKENALEIVQARNIKLVNAVILQLVGKIY